MRFSHIKKRNGLVVAFDELRITDAIHKAFVAQGVNVDDSFFSDITREIVTTLSNRFADERTPGVEDVQDIVERTILFHGYFEVAKAYMIYRYEHAKIREQKKEEIQEKIEEGALLITKRDGRSEKFDIEKIRATVARHISGYEQDIDSDLLIKQCKSEVYDGMTTADITRALIMTVRSFIERDVAYSKIAARLLRDKIYHDVFGAQLDYGNLRGLHAQAFEENIRRGVEIELLDRAMLEFDFARLADAFLLKNDDLFEYMGLEILSSRYLMEDPKTRKTIETPQMFWMRIAMGTALAEDASERTMRACEFYGALSNFYYTPGGRTLFAAGAKKAQLSNCFLNTVPDSLDGIFKTFADNAQYLKWSGGTGTDWTPVRATGADIKGTGVNSQGVIPFLKIANDVNVSINRSGKRRGAGCIYLETWHLDIEDFLELRKNTGDERRRTHDINTANWVPDLFMKRVHENGPWTLFSPEEVPDLHEIYGKTFEERYAHYEQMAQEGKMKMFKRVNAVDLWKKMLAMLFETGHPWITWKDPCNIRSPQDHVGTVHSSNLCTEITLNTSHNETAVCNLGSLNFARFVRDGVFDVELVGSVVKTAIRMLDNIIDINFYATEDSRRSNMRHRPVGLGVRGYHDALYQMGIDFDSERAVEFADQSMEIVAYHAILSSTELAKERGVYPTYKSSKWDRGILPQDTIDLLASERGEEILVKRGGKLDWTGVRESIQKYGMRNSNTMAIAPTASTANLVGCIPCVEPIYKNIYVKSNKEGDFPVLNKYLVQTLKSAGLWNSGMLNKIKYHDGSIQAITEIPLTIRERFKEVFEIDQKWLIEAAARRGKWVDQSQSLNIFFRGTSGRELSDFYFLAWRMGLKTTYYLRTLGASQVEKSTISTAVYGTTHNRQYMAVKQEVQQQQQIVSQPNAEQLSRVMAGEEVGLCDSCQG